MSDETASELPEKWAIPKAWANWAMDEKSGWTLAHVKKSAKRFHEYHRLKHTTRNSVDEWELAFRSWIRRERDEVLPKDTQHQGSLCAMHGCTALGSLAHQGGGPWYCSTHFSFHNDEGLTKCLL